MKKILVLTVGFPFPTVQGDRLRIVKMCEELSKNFSLDLLCLCTTKKELNINQEYLLFKTVNKVYLPRYKSLIQSFLAIFNKRSIHQQYYYSSIFLRMLKEKKDDYDLILAHLPRTGQYLLNITHPNMFLEMTNVFSISYKDFAKENRYFPLMLRRFIYKIEAKREKAFEDLIIPKVKICSFISEEIFKLLPRSTLEKSNVKIYPNGVDTNKFKFLTRDESSSIIFIGNMGSPQNILACKYFLDKIFPVILEEQPKLKFKIIGTMPASVFKKLGKYKNVEITGKVQEIAPHTQNAFCAVCPMFFGNTMQNKILEYMALGIPVVTNYTGILGLSIPACASSEFLIADSPQEWAFHITELYNNENLRNTLSINARKFVEKHYTWEKSLRNLNDDILKIFNEKN